NRVAVDRFVKDIPRSPRHPSYAKLVEIETALPTLADRPWLFIWGMLDWCFHAWYLDRFLKFFPKASLRRFMYSGLLVNEDAPNEMITAVNEFLSQSVPSRLAGEG